VLKKVPIISVQRLFGLAVALKIGFALLGYIFSQPVWLGMVPPMTVMVLYMYIGYHKRADDVSEEKFADSCYYIGFIFTIVSIILCLFDVPKMTAGKGMFEIAVRFGSAMVSTVLGMIVRVYLVSFKKDASDAIKDIEATLIESTRAFTLQLQDTMKNLQMFEAQVIDATKASVAGVQLQVEALGRNFSDALGRFYQQVNEENRAAFEEMLDEVRDATARLAESVDAYSGGIKGHLASIELKVTQFADAVSARLQTTTFPDDFFAKQLDGPLEQLKTEAANLGESVRGVTDQVNASSGMLGDVLKTIHTKTKKTQEAMGALVDLSEQHRTLLNNADLQLNALGRLAQRLEDVDAALKGALQVVNINSAASSELVTKVSALTMDTHALRSEIKDTITALTQKLDVNATLASGVIQKLEFQAAELRAGANTVIASLEQSTGSAERVAQQMSASVSELKVISGATVRASTGVHEAAVKTNEAAEVAVGAAQRASDVAQSVQELGSYVRQQTGGLLEAAEKLRQSNEAQPTAIADAVVKSLSSQSLTLTHPTVTSLFAQPGHGNGQVGILMVSNQVPPTEPIASQVENRPQSTIDLTVR
jgi:hypothetical protein